MNLNKVFLLGHLGKDPILRQTNSGLDVCNFSMATTETYKNKEGVTEKKTDWHQIVVWGQQAANCSKYLSKGSPVLLEGRLQSREWTREDGSTIRRTEIVAYSVNFLRWEKKREERKDYENEEFYNAG